MKQWLFIIGIGEDGVGALSAAANAIIQSAEVLVGGERHLSKVPQGSAEHLSWGDGFGHTMDKIAQLRGRRVVVLASGDPFCYGVGATLTRRFDVQEMMVLPSLSSFSLASARLGWSLPDIETITLHGRPLASLNMFISPDLRLLILSHDGDTPAKVANLLVNRGFGPSSIIVLEHMAGDNEKRLEATAENWQHDKTADLNVIAVQCKAGPDAVVFSRACGLPDDAFQHDGKITKREVRAATLAKLMPLPGQMLWDVGGGCGSVAIEWLRLERTASAVAIERHAEACATIAQNAANLGVPRLKVITGHAPEALDNLAKNPDAVFVGGGIVSKGGLLESCLQRLKPGGRLVANAVTLEAEAKLLTFRNKYGGQMSRISVEHVQSLGRFSGFKPLITVTQYWQVKQ